MKLSFAVDENGNPQVRRFRPASEGRVIRLTAIILDVIL